MTDAIGTARYRDIVATTRPVEPHEQHAVGETYWCAYWSYLYVVLAVDGDRVTVRTPHDGRTWSHLTSLGWRDRVAL